MAEEDLKQAILVKVRKEKEDILNLAKQEIEGILTQARQETSILKERYLSEIKKRGLLKKTGGLSKINLEIKKQLLEEKDKIVSEVFSRTRKNLKEIQNDRGRYKSIFKNILIESLRILDADRLKLKVNPFDKELAKDILKEFKKDIQLELQESIDGGLILCDLEENIIVLNTFESRLNKLAIELRQQINKILFENL